MTSMCTLGYASAILRLISATVAFGPSSKDNVPRKKGDLEVAEETVSFTIVVVVVVVRNDWRRSARQNWLRQAWANKGASTVLPAPNVWLLFDLFP
jgi:hypothetical protein